MVDYRIPQVIHAQPNRVQWPNGCHIAVWLVPNVESFRINSPMLGVSELPSTREYAVRDYGGRVGFWRIAEVIEEYGVPASIALNSEACDTYPDIAERITHSSWDILGHNASNSQYLPGMGPERESQLIRSVLYDIEAVTGRRPRGWLSAGLYQSPWTLSLLAQAGLDYVCDWVNEDRPYLLEQDESRLISVPYTMQIADKTIFERQGLSSEDFVSRASRQFDVLSREGLRGIPRVMAISVHPYLMGQPHRIDSLREVLDYISGHDGVWFTTGSDIADAFMTALHDSRP